MVARPRVMISAALSLALLLSGAGASRSRGAPSTTTAAPPPLPGALDLTRAVDGGDTEQHPHGSHGGDAASAADPAAACAGRRSGWSRIEAPHRLDKQGLTVDALPLERLLVAGVLLDVAGEAANSSSSSGFVLTSAHLDAWEKKNGPLPANSVLLVRFGWRNSSSAAPSHQLPQPGVSADVAARLVKQNRVVGVGVDLPALEAARDEPAARAFAVHGVYTLLNLDLSKELPAKGFSLLVLPSKAHGASMASVRVLATPRSPLLPSKNGATPSGVVRLPLLAAACLAAWARS